MMRKRTNLLVSLNFDSLTDTITNLTGTLILVVVLVVGITGLTGRGGLGSPGPARFADSLLEQLGLLRQHVQQVDRRMEDLQGRIAAIESRTRGVPQGPPAPSSGPQVPGPPGQTPPVQPKAPHILTPPRSPQRGDSLQAGVHSPRRSSGAANCRTLPASNPADNLSPAGDRDAAAGRVLSAATEARQAIERQSAGLATLSRRVEHLRRQLAHGQARAFKADSDKQARPSAVGAKGPETKAAGPKAEATPPASSERKPVKQLTYRPPIEQFTTKTPIRFICQDNRLSVLPSDKMVAEKIEAFVAASRSGTAESRPFEFDLPEYDFVFRGEAGKSVARYQAARKADRRGETSEELRRNDSKFLVTLRETAQQSPRTHCVLFYVWPDSFEVFRQARSLVWETRVGGSQYSDGWEAMLPGDPVRFVRQPGRKVHVVQPH